MSVLAQGIVLLSMLVPLATQSFSASTCELKTAAELPYLSGLDIIAVSTHGNLIAVGAWDEVLVLDATDPIQPQPVSRIPAPMGIRSIDTNGRTLAVLTTSQLLFYDFSCPASPVLKSVRNNPFAGGKVRLAGGLAYVSGLSWETTPELAAGLYIFDIASLETPLLLSHYYIGEVRDFEARDGFLALVRFGEIRILDVRVPSTPSETYSVTLSEEEFHSITASDGWLFAGSWGKVQAFEWPHAAPPTRVAEIDLGSTSRVLGLNPWGKRLVVFSEYVGAQVFDLRRVTEPQLISTLSLLTTNNGIARLDTTLFFPNIAYGLAIVDATFCEPNPRLIPVVASVPGAAGTSYSSSLVLSNPRSSPVEVRVNFWPRGSAQPDRSETITLPAQARSRIENAVNSLFHLEAAGPAIVFAPGDVGVTSYLTENTSGFGAYVDADDEALSPGIPYAFFDVREGASFRSNLLLVNTANEARSVTWTKRPIALDEALRSTMILEPTSSIQTDRFLRLDLSGDDVSSDVIIEASGDGVFAYVAQNDSSRSSFTLRRPTQVGSLFASSPLCRTTLEPTKERRSR